MSDMYAPRQMPKRFLEGAPDIVKENVLNIVAVVPAAPLDYEITLKPERAPYRDVRIYGIDFGRYGERGCHFELTAWEAARYRDRNRRKRVSWRDLPAETRAAILAYLSDD